MVQYLEECLVKYLVDNMTKWLVYIALQIVSRYHSSIVGRVTGKIVEFPTDNFLQ